MSRSLCIIPARGGSKRIPRKNIHAFRGRPIITWSIDSAIDAACFDEIMVSTDDAEIAAIARAAGANVPFLRSAEASSDTASTASVLLEVLDQYRAAGKSFEYVCCLYPTAVLLATSRLREGRDLLMQHDEAETAFSVQAFGHPIERAFHQEAGWFSLIQPQYALARQQELRPAYYDAGQFYWLRVSRFQETQAIFSPHSLAVELSELESQDINTEADWKLAEFKADYAARERLESSPSA